MQDYVEVGKIVNTHGIKGEVRVISQTDFPDKRFQPSHSLWIQLDGEWKELTLSHHRVHKQFDLLSFEGYDNINDVLSWVDHSLYIPEEDLASLDEDSFYIHDIIGLEVRDEAGQRLGHIKEVFQTGSNDVWMIEAEGKKDIALPVLKDVVRSVDLQTAIVEVSLPGGLVDNED